MKNFIVPLFWSIVGTVLVIGSIASSGPLSAFWDIPSVVITFFGSMSAVLMSFPLREIKKVPVILQELLFEEGDNRVEIIQLFSELSRKSRSKGILSIEDDLESVENPLLKNGVRMIVDGKEGEVIKSQLELEIDLIEESYEAVPLFLNKWGEFAPAFGMIGTLIGLIIMLGELDDPSLIGTGMAVALITTFYGAFLSNMVFLPMATNIQQLIDNRMITYEIILDGVLFMQEGKNPREIEERLKVYLAPKELEEYAASEPAAFTNLENQEV